MRILVVEDDPALRLGLYRTLQAEGWQVDAVTDGEYALAATATTAYDAAVLDLGLPRRHGLQVLQHWRAQGQGLAVIILTASDGLQSRLSGLNAGADDYLAKPFHMEELLARLRALLRRDSQHASAQWQCGPLWLDTRSARALVAGQPLQLTSHEFMLLAQLMQRQGEVLTRTELSEHIYPQDSDRDSNTIEVFVGRLRKKLPAGSIETVRGLGYRLVAPTNHT